MKKQTLGFVSRRLVILLPFLALGAWFPPAGRPEEPESDRGERQWAAPVPVCQPKNVFQVSETLYRGGHVTREGAAELRSLGIQTVVSFRFVGRDVRYASQAGMNAVQIPFQVWKPDEDQVVEFLKVAADPNCRPLYFACNRGADRAGMMCAAYRVAVEGWSKEEALDEMIHGPFDYNPIWKKAAQFIRDMDVERIRRRAGLAD